MSGKLTMNKMKKQLIRKSWLFAIAAFAVASCTDDNGPTPEPEEQIEGKFLVAVQASGATYFLPVDSLNNPNASITPIGNGYEFSNTFSHYVPNGYNGLVALKYGQGNAHIGQRFTINAQGKADIVGAQFELQNGFITAGAVGDVVYTLMSGFRSSEPTQATANSIPMSAGVPDYAFFKTNEFAGYEGKNAALIGIADAGNGSFFSGLDFWTEDIDDVVVTKIKASTLTVEATYSDPRLTVSGGYFRSARYSQIGTAENGDVYVFSGSNKGTKKAGALVIRKGASGFDKDYYWDIETASGGYRFRKVWPIKDNLFLLEFYNEIISPGVESFASGTIASQFAVVDMGSKKFTWISGFPGKSDIPDNGLGTPYVFQDKVYIGVTTTKESPRFYILDPETGTAQKGLLVENADAIQAASFVEKK